MSKLRVNISRFLLASRDLEDTETWTELQQSFRDILKTLPSGLRDMLVDIANERYDEPDQHTSQSTSSGLTNIYAQMARICATHPPVSALENTYFEGFKEDVYLSQNPTKYQR